MRSVHVQFLPGPNGGGCLSSVDLDSPGWDTALDLKGSLCVWPDQAHNRPNDPNVQTVITAFTAAGVTWFTTQETLDRGHGLAPPFYYFEETATIEAKRSDGLDPLDPRTPSSAFTIDVDPAVGPPRTVNAASRALRRLLLFAAFTFMGGAFGNSAVLFASMVHVPSPAT